MPNTERLSGALCLLRLSVFLVMLMWAPDRFLSPEHAAGVFSHLNVLSGLGTGMFYLLGGLELLLVAGLRRWRCKTLHVWCRAAACGFDIHCLAPVPAPYEGANLLFFTAWPMLAACLALYQLRDNDAFTLDGARRASRSR